jgi:hypothetical protein
MIAAQEIYVGASRRIVFTLVDLARAEAKMDDMLDFAIIKLPPTQFSISLEVVLKRVRAVLDDSGLGFALVVKLLDGPVYSLNTAVKAVGFSQVGRAGSVVLAQNNGLTPTNAISAKDVMTNRISTTDIELHSKPSEPCSTTTQRTAQPEAVTTSTTGRYRTVRCTSIKLSWSASVGASLRAKVDIFRFVVLFLQ